MGRIRGKLAQRLRECAIQSCQQSKRHQHYNTNQREHYSLPVIGITVANDTPDNRYLRRILHTIDLTTVGSIVITWYDEQTETQLVGKERVGLSHVVIEQALEEYISRRGFVEIPWDGGNSTALATSDLDEATLPLHTTTQLADATSLKLMSRIAISIHQFCRFDNYQSEGKGCLNELLILRFPTNLGCSSGVNNPLFTHPTAPHWLIANYDIAYPPGVLKAMGKELQMAKMMQNDLAVHTYGYIYGRGKLENPWSNFAMTSCAVANVGVWDEDIFPAYYEDDDYRDRIRYIMGEWMDVIGNPDRYGDVPQYLMNDTALIRYQTDRHVAVAHGPLAANVYLSGTHETMKKVQDEEAHIIDIGFDQRIAVPSFLISLWRHIRAQPAKPQNPFHYESHRWSIVKEVSNAEDFFRCKHGALPDAGEHGEDAVRYFGINERFLLPFVNRTRVSAKQFDEVGGNTSIVSSDGLRDPSPWAVWSFNATRRICVHKAANIILSMPPSRERENLIEKYKALCSVC